MIHNFYLKKPTTLGRMRSVEVEQFEKVKTLLRRRGVNPDRMEYQQGVQLLARLVANEVKT